jgi:ABC-type multidrug transport system permease subunit
MDEADFLQELPTTDGRRFVKVRPRIIPHTATALATAWKSSKLYADMLAEMKYASGSDAVKLSSKSPKSWQPDQQESYASKSMWFYLQLNVVRQMKILIRDATYVRARIMQVLIIGAIAGSLFSNIDAENIPTMNGFLYFNLLFTELGSYALIPMLYAQKAVFYNMKDELFFPTWTYTLSQTLSLIPLQVAEMILFTSIVYWSAGLSGEMNGSRFLTFIVICLAFSMTFAQIFRFIASIVSRPTAAMPVSGLSLIVMVLFSGFIQPKSLISNGWIWFYWMNPIAWGLKAITINEFTSSKYDFQTCTNYPSCTETKRYGDVVLEQYGNPTDEKWVWYSFAVLIAEFIFLFIITTVALDAIRSEPAPPAPKRDEAQPLKTESMKLMWEKIVVETSTRRNEEINLNEARLSPYNVVDNDQVLDLEPTASNNRLDDSPSSVSERKVIPIGSSVDIEAAYEAVPNSSRVSDRPIEELEFDRVSFAFADIWYTVTLANKEDIDLLKGVNGYFEPGTMTALMGSSGAGKTTLLDVLAGRKNTGAVKGQMFLNGYPKVEGYFRKIMGYVEQFDTLSPKSTAREAIEFSAALRLASNITGEQRDKWVNSVLAMLDLEPIENDLVRMRCFLFDCY